MIASGAKRWIVLLAAAAIGGLPCVTAFGADENAGASRHASSSATEIIIADPQKVKDKTEFAQVLPPFLKNHSFKELDDMADEIRKANFHYSDGKMKLEQFYSALELNSWQVSDEKFQAHLDDLRAWIKEEPESITARAALLSNLAIWAWKARVLEKETKTKTVSSAEFEEYSKRLKEANLVFVEASKLPRQCPHLYVAEQTVAMGMHWSKKNYDILVDEATKKFPTYYQIYFAKAFFLQPRWYGEENEWVQYADQTAKEIGGADGAKLFARIIWAIDNYNFYPNILADFGELHWAMVQTAFIALRKEYPDNLAVASEYCKLACAAKDEKTAAALMKDLGNQCVISVWKQKAIFLSARQNLARMEK